MCNVLRSQLLNRAGSVLTLNRLQVQLVENPPGACAVVCVGFYSGALAEGQHLLIIS